jgi:hypothetical protein
MVRGAEQQAKCGPNDTVRIVRDGMQLEPSCKAKAPVASHCPFVTQVTD